MKNIGGQHQVSDTIQIEEIDFLGHCGVSETERNALQRFSASIELDFDLKRAGESDHLQDTVDYEAVTHIVLSVGQSRSFSLLEAMAEEMAGRILSQFPVKGVMIFLKKIVPPVPAIRGYFAVKIYRAR
ncbi:MAG: dihydroneopterin aldolase [Nitrospirae bacterium]|nr:dihydroneopterin aldolase [Nitrospirota bacterium]